jgi:hypothetical protein
MPRLELGIIARFQRDGVPVILANISDPAVVRSAIQTAINSARQGGGDIAQRQQTRLLGELLAQMDRQSVA